MNAPLKKQHLIDPEICIRCNTCEETCPVDAVTHNDDNYVVRAEICNYCMDCIAPCPTGAIDNWRVSARAKAWTTSSAGASFRPRTTLKPPKRSKLSTTRPDA
jgi:MinD superfamily P-loop ATPase